MQHYYGGKAICERLGINSPSYLSRLIRHKKVPVFSKRKGIRNILYTNEALLLSWELENVQRYRARVEVQRAKQSEAKREARRVLKNMRTVA